MNEISMFWGSLVLLLTIIELISGSMFLIPLILGGVLMALIGFMGSMSFNMQLLWFSVFVIISAYVLFFVMNIRGKHKALKIGQSQSEVIGEIGLISLINDESSGLIRFDNAVMGSREWIYTSKDKLEVNQAAKIESIIGNKLVVKKLM